MLKQICFLSLITTLIFGCSSNQKPEPTPPTLPKKVTVLLTPNSSIRAIETKGENGVWWAGSNGNYGYTKDGGKTWETARLAKPGEKMALTRFYLDTDWDGSEMMLQSRAMDDTGYVQPTKTQLREVRGLNSIYHNNCIQTWLVRSNGEAENVEVS